MKLAVALLVLVAAIYLPKVLWPEAAIYKGLLREHVLSVIATTCKLAALGTGAIYGARCTSLLERGNPARPAWALVTAWLGAFFVGQAILSTYHLVLKRPNPLPSPGDLFFVLGYLAMIAAAVQLLRVYRASGLPLGSPRELLAIGGVAMLTTGALGYVVLQPVATAPEPLAERVINVAYPMLDFVALVPTIVLLRMTVRLRGGRVWSIWAALLLGLSVAAAGDILFAYYTSAHRPSLEPLVDLAFIVSYFLLSSGAVLQRRLMD
jgi:hypothetical protein